MNENSVINLDNNESYLIISKITIDFIDYYYLCSTIKPLEMKIAVIKDNKLQFVQNEETMTYVLNKFVEKIQNEINE